MQRIILPGSSLTMVDVMVDVMVDAVYDALVDTTADAMVEEPAPSVMYGLAKT